MRATSRLLVIGLLLAVPARLSAQDPAAKKKAEPPEIPFELQDFWLKDAGSNLRGWATCFGSNAPLGPAWNPCGMVAARFMLADPVKGLPGWELAWDECYPIWHRYLESIKDGRPLPSVKGKELRELSPPDWGMYLALVQAVDLSHLATLDMFKKSADGNDHVGYPHLTGTPDQYRGKIITVKGNITRVLKEDAPRYAKSDIQYVYSTSIQGKFKKEPPFVVLFTELPPEVSYKERLDLEVTFYGYFLGNVMFVGDPGRREKNVVCPYLVGKTLIVDKITPVAADDPEPYSANLIGWTVGLVAAALALAVLLNFWFRRGDKRIANQLAQVHEKHNPFKLEPDAPPIADPVQPPDGETPG